MTVANAPKANLRLYSIDVLRALTMFFMIFVNDLWTLIDVPEWMEHALAKEDRLGFADTIFPAFLVIVGMSIPFAIHSRIQKGDSTRELIKHVLLRTLALVVMGVFHVNLENYNRAAAILPKPVWEIFITIGFFLIWLDYPGALSKSRKWILQSAGLVILAVMAALFQGGTPEHPEWMRFHWWGILGLIGWAYFTCSMLFIWFRDNLAAHCIAFVFFIFFNGAGELHWLGAIDPIRPFIWFVGDGSGAGLVMAGIILSLLYRKMMPNRSYLLFLALFAGLMIAFGYATRPLWGIHKIGASPSWVTICIGYTAIVFGLLIMLVDLGGKKAWFDIIKPAGTSTLTCYLVPYLYYSVYSLVGVRLPEALRTAPIGIVKSLLFALLVILITGFLEKRKIRLKL